MRALNSTALVALLLAGCGGGGSDETAVSASPAAPPAAAAPSPSPAPSTLAPVAPPKTPVATPSPPAAGSPPAAAAPAVPTIPGERVISALVGFTPGRGVPTELRPVGFAGDPISLYQDERYVIGTSGNPDTFLPMFLAVPADFEGGRRLSSELAIDSGAEMSVVMKGPELVVRSEEAILLPSTLNTWAGPSGQFTRLLLSEQGADAFNVCWHVEALVSLKRLTCNTFARATSEWLSAYVIDNRDGVLREYR